MCENLPGRVGGLTGVCGGALEERHPGLAVCDHQRALRFGHPAGLDHAAITTTTRHPLEVLQQATPPLAGAESEQKNAGATGCRPERSGTDCEPPLHSTCTLTTAAPAPSARDLGPTRPTRSPDIPWHAVGQLAPARACALSAPAPSTGPLHSVVRHVCTLQARMQ